jgi:methyltransferase (TIGR00027 family)
MEEERPSLTAEGAALMRVIHQQQDDEPKILEDPVTPRLFDLNSDFYRSRLKLLEELPAATRQRLKATFVMRSRYAEDCLAEAAGRGVRQYVILGAGLDTFAYRQPSWAQALSILEIDHPATQQWKLRLLTQGGIAVPGNVRLVPVNFEKASLKSGLAEAGVDFGAPIFFSMLGVSQYLTETAFEQTLDMVLSAVRGSELVFSFVATDEVLPPDDTALVRASIAQFAAMGEPWLLRIAPEQLAAKLGAKGFAKVFHLTPDLANARYFQNRSDGLCAAFIEQMMSATV